MAKKKRPSGTAYFTKRYHPPGTAPGTLVGAPAGETGPIRIRLVDYSPEELFLNEDASAAECLPYLERDTVTWVHVQGQPPPDMLRALGETFHLHTLAMEDVLNTGQRPKAEAFDHQLFLILSLPMLQEDTVVTRQVSLFASEHSLVSFCEGTDDPFMPLLKRLQDKATRLRNSGGDFLLYTILDLVIDQGFPVLETFGLQLENLEEKIAESADRDMLGRIHAVKRELILLRRMLWPQREVVSQLLRDGHQIIGEGTRVYLRDCYDHAVQIMDLLETYRDMAGSMLDIYLSSLSNRLNESMRILTVIATIFIPLTFIVGVYGMNFDRSSPWNMPELGWAYGYPLIWLLMLAIAIGMILYFKRRGWF